MSFEKFKWKCKNSKFTYLFILHSSTTRKRERKISTTFQFIKDRWALVSLVRTSLFKQRNLSAATQLAISSAVQKQVQFFAKMSFSDMFSIYQRIYFFRVCHLSRGKKRSDIHAKNRQMKLPVLCNALCGSHLHPPTSKKGKAQW